MLTRKKELETKLVEAKKKAEEAGEDFDPENPPDLRSFTHRYRCIGRLLGGGSLADQEVEVKNALSYEGERRTVVPATTKAAKNTAATCNAKLGVAYQKGGSRVLESQCSMPLSQEYNKILLKSKSTTRVLEAAERFVDRLNHLPLQQL